MLQLKNCPVCNSQNIRFRNKAGTSDAPKEPLKWSVYGCDDCGLGFLDPQPTWEELIPYYPPDYLCYTTSVEDEERVVEEARRRGEYRHIPIPVGKRLLDVGCGGGAFLQVLKKLGVEVKGVDPGVSATAAARDSGLDVFTGTLEEYIAQHGTDEKFDVITCSHVLMATPSPAQTLDCMRQLLAPNGYIWVAVPNADCESARDLGWRWHSTYFARNFIQFSPKTLSKAGEVAGRGNSATVHLFFPRSCGLFALFAVAPSLVHTAQNFQALAVGKLSQAASAGIGLAQRRRGNSHGILSPSKSELRRFEQKYST